MPIQVKVNFVLILSVFVKGHLFLVIVDLRNDSKEKQIEDLEHLNKL